MPARKKSAREISDQARRLRDLAYSRGQYARGNRVMEIGDRYTENIGRTKSYRKMSGKYQSANVQILGQYDYYRPNLTDPSTIDRKLEQKWVKKRDYYGKKAANRKYSRSTYMFGSSVG